MNQYYLFRLEAGSSRAEQRATDVRNGELAAALAGTYYDLRRILSHGLGALAALGGVLRARRPGKRAVDGARLAGQRGGC